MPNEYRKKGISPLGALANLAMLGGMGYALGKKEGLWGQGSAVQSDAPRGVVPGGPEAIPPKGMTGVMQIDGTAPQFAPPAAAAREAAAARAANVPKAPQARPKVAAPPPQRAAQVPVAAQPAGAMAPPTRDFNTAWKAAMQAGKTSSAEHPQVGVNAFLPMVGGGNLVSSPDTALGLPKYDLNVPMVFKADGGCISPRSSRSFPKKGG